MATSVTTSSPNIRSLIPARVDRLPWSKFHTRLVIALGVAWILDGLEITIASNVGPDLTLHNTLNMSAGAVSDIAWWYLIGEVIGALFFGRLSDKLGRRNLFMVTLGVYLIGSGLTAFTPAGGYWFIFLYATRVIAGMGIGGEYAAINSAIDEMIPEIEADVAATKGDLPPVDPSKEIEIRPTDQIGYLALTKVLFQRYPSRSILGAALMITQSFLYNAIFFTYGLVLLYFFKVPATDTAYYFMAFAVGNLLGPLTLGRLFDTVGRRKMISGTYILSGVLLAISAELFRVGALNAVTQTICWTVVFFFASAGASAGYLTVSEVFPLEVRAKAIAVFFAVAQLFGAFGSHWYGHLIGNGTDRGALFAGYIVGAAAMILGGVIAIFCAVDAEGKSLEDVATPLSVIAKPAQTIFRTGAPPTASEG